MASPTSTNALSISLIFALAIMLSLVGENCEAATSNILLSGEIMYAEQALYNGYYKFIIQADCNLVLYDSERALWASNTDGKGLYCKLNMQEDGNLVIYNTHWIAIWNSNTNRGMGNYSCVLEDDGNVVIYHGTRFIWATGTGVTTVPPKANHTSAAVVNGGGGGR